MFKPVITVTFDDGDGKRVCCSQELKPITNYETMTSAQDRLDHPSRDADGWTRTFCSDPKVLRAVMKDRKQIAKDIEGRVVDMILEALGAGDTVNGYPKPHPKPPAEETS